MHVFGPLLLRQLARLAVPVAVLAGSSYAFAAHTHTQPAARAGVGTVPAAGYTASRVSYTYSSHDPEDISRVRLRLDHRADVVKLQLASGGTWYACAPADASGTEWVCDTTVGDQATLASENELSVIAHTM